jgi:hypothetical membrane protein
VRNEAAALNIMIKVQPWQRTSSFIDRMKPVCGASFRYVYPLAGITGPVILVLTDNIATILSSGYDPFQMVISDLALGPVGWLARMGFCLFGILVIIEAIGLDHNIRSKKNHTTTLAAFIIIGLGFILVAAFNADPHGVETHTLHGWIHGVTVAVIAVLFPIACLLLVPRLRSDQNWNKLWAYTLVTAVITVVLDIIRLVMPAPWRWYGLHERLMLWNGLLWFEVIGIKLLIVARHKRAEMKEIHGVYHASDGS